MEKYHYLKQLSEELLELRSHILSENDLLHKRSSKHILGFNRRFSKGQHATTVRVSRDRARLIKQRSNIDLIEKIDKALNSLRNAESALSDDKVDLGNKETKAMSSNVESPVIINGVKYYGLDIFSDHDKARRVIETADKIINDEYDEEKFKDVSDEEFLNSKIVK